MGVDQPGVAEALAACQGVIALIKPQGYGDELRAFAEHYSDPFHETAVHIH